MIDQDTARSYLKRIKQDATRIASLEREVEELRGENARMRSERLYIIGFNAGWESAHEQQSGDDSPFGEIAGFDPIDYALHYGGRCRDCADADGVCPSSGMPCDPAEARKAAGHVLKAWKYGIEHGYMGNPFAAAIRRIKPSEAEGRE